MTEVTFYPKSPVNENQLKYVVIAARFRGQWIFCRHKQRSTWEIPGGHREIGESADQAARRELQEKTGAVNAAIKPIGIYGVHTDSSMTYGMLYFAEVTELSVLSGTVEIGETVLSAVLPAALTYPDIQPKLFHWVQGWLNMQANAEELWDIYDENRELTGRTHRRGDFLAENDYHLVVYAWIMRSNGEFLITKRSPNKGFPNMWEATGGSAIAGDDSLTAAIREVREETGLVLRPDSGKRVITYRGTSFFADVWVFQQDFDLSDVVLLEGETCDAQCASRETILRMYDEGQFVPYKYIHELFELL